MGTVRPTAGHPRRRLSPRRVAFPAIAGGAALLLALSITGSVSAATTATAGKSPLANGGGNSVTGDRAPFYDSRQDATSRQILRVRTAQQGAQAKPGLKAMRAALGVQGVLAIDPLTGTPSAISRLDGFLTGASKSAPATVVTSYVKANPDVFGLSSADLSTLRLRKDYVDVAGIHHLSWVQYAGKVPVFGNGLKAAVAKDGRLINVQGSPIRGLGSASTSTKVSAAAARSAAASDVFGSPRAATAGAAAGSARATRFSNGDSASLVTFQTVSGSRVAWQTLTTVKGHMFAHVVDAATARVLYRHDLTSDANPTGRVWENYPGAAAGGTQTVVNLAQPGWLPAGATKLSGNTAHVFSDVNDDNAAQAGEEVHPGANSFQFPFVNFN
ncbi:MAG: hypothetical protein M3O55_04815, partial [Actinomycetota bacterium]|nr:hypothetical protein [Actinomycetota bacterium]